MGKYGWEAALKLSKVRLYSTVMNNLWIGLALKKNNIKPLGNTLSALFLVDLEHPMVSYERRIFSAVV